MYTEGRVILQFLRRAWAEIDISALVHNFKIIREKVGNTKIMAVVKANAYGHSALCAAALEQNGADYFAVSNIEEALELRNHNINKPILILGYTPPELARSLYEHNIEQCIFSEEYAKELSLRAAQVNAVITVHIKIDTGMSRIGFNCRTEELAGIDAAIAAAKLPNFKVKGIFTHFAVSDRNERQEDGFTDEQYSRFTAAIEKFNQNGLYPEIRHCANSGAILNDADKRLDAVRAGIILYGLTPSADLTLSNDFIPVMTFKSVVTMVKEIDKDDTVSYGRTFKAKNKMKIATVAVGYADGYPRALSNKAYVLINGQKAPVIGRVCMDQITVDVSDIDDIKTGDEVILFGKELPVELLADICNTINYEIVCGITARVPRVIKE